MSEWQGGENFVKIKRGSANGGANNSGGGRLRGRFRADGQNPAVQKARDLERAKREGRPVKRWGQFKRPRR